jgi:hypothetical protein
LKCYAESRYAECRYVECRGAPHAFDNSLKKEKCQSTERKKVLDESKIEKDFIFVKNSQIRQFRPKQLKIVSKSVSQVATR